MTVGASVALGVCAGVAYSTYESSLYAPVATTTRSVATVAPIARAAAGHSFVEASYRSLLSFCRLCSDCGWVAWF